jgi:hypothetical protein
VATTENAQGRTSKTLLNEISRTESQISKFLERIIQTNNPTGVDTYEAQITELQKTLW